MSTVVNYDTTESATTAPPPRSPVAELLSLAGSEAAYLRIMVGGAVLKLLQITFAQFLLAINRPMAVLSATLFGVSVNALAAWVFIYGRLGLPPMGIRGSALGQNVGVLVE